MVRVMPSIPKIFELIDQSNKKKEDLELLRTHISTYPGDVYKVYVGMSVYAYAASFNFEILKLVHETFENTISKMKNKDNKQNPWDVKGENGYAALHYTVDFNLVKELQYLVEFANVNIEDNQFNTPLHLACMYNRLHIFKILSNTPNINVNAINKDGKTPLYLAVLDNNIEMIRKLLQKGASLDYRIRMYKHTIDVNIPNKTKMFTTDITKRLLAKSVRNPRKIKKKIKESIQKQQIKKGFKLQYDLLCKNLQDESNKELVNIFALKLKIDTKDKTKSQICESIANRMFLKTAHPTAFAN
jgi:hypothetical protein